MNDEPNQDAGRPAVARRGPRRREAVEVAATALAGGATVQDAAEQAGIGRRTLTRWLASPKFAARVEALRTAAVATAMNRMTSAMSAAADTLTQLLDSGRSEMRLKAARAVLELGMRLKEHGELVQRITELERRAAADSPARRPRIARSEA